MHNFCYYELAPEYRATCVRERSQAIVCNVKAKVKNQAGKRERERE